MVVEWGTVAASVLGALVGGGGLAVVLGNVWMARVKNAVEERIAEAARLSNERIAEGGNTTAVTLARNETLTQILTRVNRQASDALAFAHNATIEYYRDDIPLGTPHSYANHPAEAGEDARTEADAYLISGSLGKAVTHLRTCEANLSWAGQNQEPDPFDENDPLITNLRAAAEEVRVQVQGYLSRFPPS